ncbi:site-specific DNA-methyltransferase [Nocardia cyriacigeorgica]|uniref:Site-specific DNA-methyltransferase n=1 Tax=Nocardia cyriacigeorgica TaxID=135487 RepID=A0A6P1CM15_9NOCA|nr:site-specific DNA-methyltransferase [Nocardia cyriacigeorgica]NEW32942.1 site-specific DNA-methyltransferase [Nocardia cyriacigeorgica]
MPRDDPRFAEVRLLHEKEVVGQVNPAAKATSDNLLIVGDSYDALQSLNRIPEYASEYRGRVKLVYIDPPFNTGQAFQHYDDALEHSVWLTMMRDRLLLIRDLLAPDGSVWVHLDDAEMAYCRVLMDEIFGRESFISSIIWQKADSPRNSARHFSVDQDYIHVYARDPAIWRPYRLPRTEETDKSYRNPDNDPRGPWTPGDPFANKPYSLGQYEVTGPTGNVFGPPPGRYWRISKERFEELDREGRIWWRGGGDARPRIKRYLSEVADLVPRTVWDYKEVGSSGDSSREMRRLLPEVPVFSTPKPERLLQRILTIATRPGDIVLDCFAGSGTTAAVAHKMERRWVTVELSSETVETFARPRLEMVVNGEDSGGVTKAVGWEKGGGFRLLEIGPSMYNLAGGHVFLAEWATNGAFARAVAAQLDFTVQDEPPFCGVKGRSRLAVIDGIVDEQVIRAVVARLSDAERAVVVGKGATAGAGPLLKELNPGSRLRKAPRDLLKRGVVR